MTGPTSGRVARLLTLCAALGLAAAVASGCGGGDSASVSGEPIGFEQLASSAQASADAESGRFAFSMEMSAPGSDEAFAFAGEGAFDVASDRASFSVDLSSFAALLGGLFAGATGGDLPDFDDPAGWRIDAIQDGSVTYVRFPAISDQLPSGASWVRDDGTSAGGTKRLDFDEFEELTKTDPRELLELLRGAAGEVEIVGAEELRGVSTTHYRAVVDPARYGELAPAGTEKQLESLVDEIVSQSGIGQIPVDVWMDAKGMVRKLEMSFSGEQPGSSGSAEASVSFELWDYGEEVAIALPPASQVVDASALKD